MFYESFCTIKKTVQGSVCDFINIVLKTYLIYNKSYFSVFSFDVKFNDYIMFVATFTVILFTI